MARRDYRQMSLADALVGRKQRRRKRLERLETMHQLVDWTRVDRLLSPISASLQGAEGYPPSCLFKALLLATWYDLSDPLLEDALADRLTFRRFCGFPLDEETPDETTFVRFRAKLRELGLFEKLFQEINRQLDAKGLFVKKGTLVDATIVEADARRPSKQQGEVSGVDPDATFTKKHGNSYFGYKMHAGIDEGSGLIRKIEGTTASVHDSQVFGPLISADEAAVYGDKAYGSQANRDYLKELGIKDQLMHKAARNKPLKSWQRWFNKAVSGIRSAVERPFATGKGYYGLGRARYRGQDRVNGQFHMFAMAYNMRRAVSLV